MKKLIAVMTVLCLLCASVCAFAETETETKEIVFSNGVKFGMSVEDVIAIDGTPHKRDTEQATGVVIFEKLEYENVADSLLENALIDRDYLFVDGKLAAVRIGLETKDIPYEKVKESLSAFGTPEALNSELLGNGIFAVDDDGIPEQNVLAFVDGNIVIVLELDDNGEDMDVTIIDLTAGYIK